MIKYSALKYSAYKFIFISTVLFAVFVSVSIAADNLAISIGVLGLIFLIIAKEFKFKKEDLPIGLFSLKEFFSSVFSLNPIHSLLNFQYIWHFAPYWITSRSKANFTLIVNVLGVFTIIGTLGLYFNAFFGIRPVDIFSVGINNLHFVKPMPGIFGFSGCASYAGIIMVMSSFFFGSLGIFLKNKFYYLVSILAFFAGILAQERADWLAIIVSILCLPLILRNKKTLILLLLFAVVSIGFYNTSFIQKRLNQTIYYEKDPGIVIRFAMMKASLEVFKESSMFRKIFGYGPSFGAQVIHKKAVFYYKQMAVKNHIDPNIEVPTTIDNFYFNTLMNSGLFGLALILCAFLMLLINNIKRLKSADTQQKGILVGIILGLIAFYVASGFDNLLGSAQVSIYLSFMLGLAEIGLKNNIL
ncbi:O-antigen ligase [Desulfurella sp.]|uniref:O-antigen ligase family protein n=1 Tax=Desulfurella sp. TaxID=1962857 RepID=UPI0025C69D90|nr:O-antigen ligase family protein [Desulfurella sp.]